MSRFIGLIITVVAVAALAGAAIGWRFPFLGRNQSANQVQNPSEPEVAQNQRDARGRTLGVSRSNSTDQAQNPDTTVNPEGTTPTQSAEVDTNQSVPALW